MSEHRTHRRRRVMDRVIEIRYSDLEEEKRLCKELLEWALEEGDAYGIAFAHAYLGDYHIAQNESERALEQLAESLLAMAAIIQPHDELRLRVFSLLSIGYEVQGDEQNATHYYMESIMLARKMKDLHAECLILNNLAFAFERHHKFDEAQKYYEQAYHLQQTLPHQPLQDVLISNLTSLALEMGELARAREYLERDAFTQLGMQDTQIYHCRNWCCYWAMMGERERALEWADKVLRLVESNINRLSAFEDYNILCKSMMRIGDQPFAARFLALMEQASVGGGLDQGRMLECRRVEYSLRFLDETKQAEAYRAFFRRMIELQKRRNLAVAESMKAKIKLDQELHQNQTLQSEQETLSRQANLDELTGLYNRRYFSRLMREWTDAPDGAQLGVVMLDIDYFKEYNDFYGHLSGDLLLKAIAACLSVQPDARIIPCRYGGDEFICLCKGLDEAELAAYIESVRTELARRAVAHEKSACDDCATLSIGYALDESDAKENDPYLLMQLADQALYESKRLGRNTFTRKWVDAV